MYGFLAITFYRIRCYCNA